MGYRPSFKISVTYYDTWYAEYNIRYKRRNAYTTYILQYLFCAYSNLRTMYMYIYIYIYIYDHPLTVGVLVQYVCSIHSVHVYKTANVGYMKFHYYDLLYEPQVIRGTYSTAAARNILRTVHSIIQQHCSTASSLHHFDQFFNKNYFNIFQNSKWREKINTSHRG